MCEGDFFHPPIGWFCNYLVGLDRLLYCRGVFPNSSEKFQCSVASQLYPHFITMRLSGSSVFSSKVFTACSRIFSIDFAGDTPTLSL